MQTLLREYITRFLIPWLLIFDFCSISVHQKTSWRKKEEAVFACSSDVRAWLSSQMYQQQWYCDNLSSRRGSVPFIWWGKGNPSAFLFFFFFIFLLEISIHTISISRRSYNSLNIYIWCRNRYPYQLVMGRQLASFSRQTGAEPAKILSPNW